MLPAANPMYTGQLLRRHEKKKKKKKKEKTNPFIIYSEERDLLQSQSKIDKVVSQECSQASHPFYFQTRDTWSMRPNKQPRNMRTHTLSASSSPPDTLLRTYSLRV